MATHALLSLDKGNRASSWVWEFDPTHTHTHTHTHTMYTLQQWGHIHQRPTSCASSPFISAVVHFHMQNPGYVYLDTLCSGQRTTWTTWSDTGEIHAAARRISRGDFDGILFGICWPRAILESIQLEESETRICAGRCFSWKDCFQSVLKDYLHYLSSWFPGKKYLVLLSVISSQLMSFSSVCYD